MAAQDRIPGTQRLGAGDLRLTLLKQLSPELESSGSSELQSSDSRGAAAESSKLRSAMRTFMALVSLLSGVGGEEARCDARGAWTLGDARMHFNASSSTTLSFVADGDAAYSVLGSSGLRRAVAGRWLWFSGFARGARGHSLLFS